MRRRRSTVYVRPGKDVTLYVPVETPPEVIEHLNHLKEEGVFSQGVIEMITQYVRRRSTVVSVESSAVTGFDLLEPEARPAESDPVKSDSEGQEGQHPRDSDHTTGSHKLNLSQIFDQAQRNSEKLIDS